MWRLSESAGQCRVKRQRQDNPSSLSLTLSLPRSLFLYLSVSVCLSYYLHLNVSLKYKDTWFVLFSLNPQLNFSAHLCHLFSVFVCVCV